MRNIKLKEQRDLPSKILIVDSDVNVAKAIIEPFDQLGIEIIVASDYHTAKHRVDKEFFRVIFISAKFEDHNALDLIQKWKQHDVTEKKYASFVILSQYEIAKEKISLLSELGGIKTIPKPLAFGPALNVVKESYNAYHLKKRKEGLFKKITSEFNSEKISLNDAISLAREGKETLQDIFYPLMVDLHKIDDSLNEAKNILNNAPKDAMPELKMLNLKGEVHLLLGEHEQAKSCFEKADVLAPRNMERINKLIDTFLELKQPELAIKRQKEMMDINKDDPDMKFDMFKKLEEYGFGEHAVEFCREVSNPSEVLKYFNNKGVSFSKQGRHLEAIKEYERAISYFPASKKNYLIHYNIALALVKSKNKQNMKSALVSLERCLRIKDDFDKAFDLKDKINKILGNVNA